MKKWNLVAKPSKCFMCQREVTYLGHVVGYEKVRLDPHNVSKIIEAKPSTTVKEVRSFLGLASYYRRFIKNFADIAHPLTELQKRGVLDKGAKRERGRKVNLPKEALKAFAELKRQITSDPILSLPDFEKPFGVRTDASDYAIGGVLFQCDEDGNEKPLCYASRVLIDTEKNYSASEREILAIHDWIRYWRPYLWGVHFDVYTDHSPLRNIHTDKDTTR